MQILTLTSPVEPTTGPTPDRLTASLEIVGCAPTVVLDGELDTGTRHVLADVVPALTVLCRTVHDGDAARGLVRDSAVVVDTAGLTFVDAAGLGTLIHAGQELVRAGFVLRIVHPSARLRRISGICGLDDTFGLIVGRPRGATA